MKEPDPPPKVLDSGQETGCDENLRSVAQQPKTLASMLKSTAPVARQELEVSVDKMLGEIKSVFYYISNRLNRKSLLEMFRKNFKSLAFENYRFYECDGVKFIVLEIGLFTNSLHFIGELGRSASVSYKNTVIQSVPDESLDARGNFIPKPERKVLISGLSLSSLNPGSLAWGFEGYVKFSQKPTIVLLGDKTTGRFSGDAVVHVEKFIKLPENNFNFKIEGIGNYQRINVKSFGFPRILAEELKKECYRCGAMGHFAGCPNRPTKFSWKCTSCGNDSNKYRCTVRKCLEPLAHVAQAQVPQEITENMYSPIDIQKIRQIFDVRADVQTWYDINPKVGPGL